MDGEIDDTLFPLLDNNKYKVIPEELRQYCGAPLQPVYNVYRVSRGDYNMGNREYVTIGRIAYNGGILPLFTANGACSRYNLYMPWTRHFQSCNDISPSHVATHFCALCEEKHPIGICFLLRAGLQRVCNQ